MNLGIVMAVSEYVGNLTNLPGCNKDAEAISKVLRTESRFEDVLIINDSAESAKLKARLIDFISKHKKKEVQEVFFYYSGHGEFNGNEFYYLLSDFDLNRRKQTSLENSELDRLLRTLDAELTVKVIDACQSGVPYIKDPDSFGKFLKGTQGAFKNCYFLYSSQTDQSSYQDEALSFFTRSIVQAIVEHPASTIRYKDIIDYVSDSFTRHSLQTPFFVIQSDLTEQFCTITQTLRKDLAEIIAGGRDLSPVGESAPSAGYFKNLVIQEAKDYCTEQEAIAILKGLFEKMINYEHPQEALDLFEVEYEIEHDHSKIPNISTIGNWLYKNEHSYFAEPIIHHEKREFEVADTSYDFYRILNPLKKRITRDVAVAKGFRSTIDMPFNLAVMRAKSRFSNLRTAACFVVPIISKTHVRFFAAFTSYRQVGWDKEEINGDIKWTTVELKLKDDTQINNYLDNRYKEFWEFTLVPIKKRLGLLPPEDPKDESKSEESSEPHTKRRTIISSLSV